MLQNYLDGSQVLLGLAPRNRAKVLKLSRSFLMAEVRAIAREHCLSYPRRRRRDPMLGHSLADHHGLANYQLPYCPSIAKNKDGKSRIFQWSDILA